MGILSFIVAILPVLLIGLYIYKKDKNRSSLRLLFSLFLGGIFSCFPAIFISSILNILFPLYEDASFIRLFLYVFISIALVEELCKWIFLYRISYNHKEFNDSYDMIIYASFVALGFACLENILYIYSYGISVGFLRSILAVPGHACYGILMGIYLSIAKMKGLSDNKNDEIKYKLYSILIPIIIHGIYDLCLFIGNSSFVFIFSIFVVFLDVICFVMIKYISSNSIEFKEIKKNHFNDVSK